MGKRRIQRNQRRMAALPVFPKEDRSAREIV
jgi:hypothetical protein